MTDSLRLVSPRLAAAIDAADDAARRRAILAGVRLAVGHAHLGDPRADQALSALADGVLGSPEERAAVQRLTAELDEEAFTLRDQIATGEATREEYMQVFYRARAAAALDVAFEEDAARAASESLYEAHHAINELPTLEQAVLDALA